VKPNINSVEVHPQLSNKGHAVDGALVGAGSLWPGELAPKTATVITRGVLHCGLAIYIKKYLNTKEQFWKFKYFTM
jgi:hypothetical protein